LVELGNFAQSGVAKTSDNLALEVTAGAGPSVWAAQAATVPARAMSPARRPIAAFFSRKLTQTPPAAGWSGI
jgi:hypothetical protein